MLKGLTKSFALDRLLAIFYHIVQIDPVPSQLQVHIAINDLTKQGLFASSTSEGRMIKIKLQSMATSDMINWICHELRFDLQRHLTINLHF